MLRIAAEVAQHCVDSDLAGKLTRRLPAHAVTNDEDAVPYVKAEIVLVVGAHHTNVRFAGGLDHQIHSTPLQALNPILVLVGGKYFWSGDADEPNLA